MGGGDGRVSKNVRPRHWGCCIEASVTTLSPTVFDTV